MEDDLGSGATVAESPFAEALEIQQKRVLDTVEVAVLQAVNDIRENFEDLSEADEIFFEARLQGEILGDALDRYLDLTKKLTEEEDPRHGVMMHALKERLKNVDG